MTGGRRLDRKLGCDQRLRGRRSTDPASRPVGEKGSGTVLMAGSMVVVVLLAGGVMLVAGYLLAAHRARAAADLAALSGAAAYPQGRSCVQAASIALGNGARLIDCSSVGDLIDYVVTVRVAVPAGAHLPGLPTTVSAVAYAGPT